LLALDQQMAQPEIWKRAEGYGMPGRRFNGFDPIDTYAAVKEAMDRARSGGGPMVIVCLSSRVNFERYAQRKRFRSLCTSRIR